MEKSLAETIENLKQEGFKMVELLKNGSVKVGESIIKEHSELSIIDVVNFEAGSSPSEEVNLYKLLSPNGEKCYTVLGFGEHIDSEHANLINHLLRKRSPK